MLWSREDARGMHFVLLVTGVVPSVKSSMKNLSDQRYSARYFVTLQLPRKSSSIYLQVCLKSLEQQISSFHTSAGHKAACCDAETIWHML